MPYYDSLLVKIIAYDRTFDGTVRKCVRALKETRIRGVKTNIPFLINVVQSDVFQQRKCTTTFIEETPELFNIAQSKDRASKIAEFIGNKIVNESKGEKPDFGPIAPPKYNKEMEIYGARDEFLKLGAEGYTKKILNDKKLYITDTTMRDAHQSLVATRFRTRDLVTAAPAANVVLRNAFSAEVWGGATFDTLR